MAIWQFDLSFFPRGGPTPWRVADGHQVPSVESSRVTEAKAWLFARYGEPQNMLEDWLVYGSENGSRFDLLLNEDGTAEVSARIDARTEPKQFVAELCELSSLLDCGLFSAEFWKQLEATPVALGHALERSRAAEYIRNPEKVLRGSRSDA